MTVRVLLRSRGPAARTLREACFEVDAERPLTFGRSEQNRLQVPDDKKMVSSQHGRIELRGADYWVVDLGSTNGTHVDGTVLQGEGGVPLADGARIVIGEFELQVFLHPGRAADGLADGVDGGEAEATLHGFDPDRLAAAAWDELCARHAAARREPAAARHDALAAALRERLQRLLPAQARAVLGRIAGRLAAPDAGQPAPAGEAPEEQLLQEALAGLQRLARATVGERRLLSARDAARFAGQLETFLRLVLPWLHTCLKGRAGFEDEFGAEVTMVFQRSNNPLKGLAAADLGTQLFDWQTERPPHEQRAHLEGILRDLTQHQLGLLGGVREAVRSVTERLAPEAIEALARKDAGWLSSKGAKAWEVYTRIYRDLLEEKSKLFHEVISPAIRRGYLAVHEAPRGGDAAGPSGAGPPGAGAG